MKRRIARSVFSKRLTSGSPPEAGNVADTSESLCWSIATHVLTSAGAAELTSGMAGPPSYAALAARSMTTARLTREPANAEGQPPNGVHTD